MVALDHPFIKHPHRTLIALSVPVTISLAAEPLTALVDTAFIAQLGLDAMAGLGVGTTILSTILWVFSFLGVSAQTEVANAFGQGNLARARQFSSLALIVGSAISLLLIVIFLPLTPQLTQFMGASGEVGDLATMYIRIRLFGAPAVLLTMICLGILRGLQEMRIALWIALLVNILNVVLDAVLIFGFGPIQPMGMAGAAFATIIAQWIGTVWGIYRVMRRLGFELHLNWADMRLLGRVGRDLFVRTGLLTLFTLFATRVANQVGPDAGAAHQAIRSMWMFVSFMMEGFSVTAQSLIGYFMGASVIPMARRASSITLRWGVIAGGLISVIMLLGRALVIDLLVPAEAVTVFVPAWTIAALLQPIAAVAFVTDGVHWGTGDYAYMRNGMILASGIGGLLLWLVDPTGTNAFLWVWLVTLIWLAVRAAFGLIRIWPGVGRAPFYQASTVQGSQSGI